MKGNWKVGFQLSLLLITFWKEFQATKEKWKKDIVSFLIFFCSFQKLKKEKKRRNKRKPKGNQKDLPIFSDTCATTLYSDNEELEPEASVCDDKSDSEIDESQENNSFEVDEDIDIQVSTYFPHL